MSEIAIRADKLGKLYRIGQAQQYRALRDTLNGLLRAPFRGPRDRKQDAKEWLWAVRDVSFEIKRGELIGIIGRNGAGKSTLLKLLSRITHPTEGCADMYGRVGSLLEVGTGFHAELTGRENIFLNGAILGMRKAEIARKFDEVVAFAEVERFIDTPVKHYSSGMYMRLAFAVAAHLETEILIVDEVLAVGDAEFQKKCLGKMEDVTRGGRTVLFVSHSMSSIQRLCQRGLLMSKGGLEFDGPIDGAIHRYLTANASSEYAAEPRPAKATITHARAEWLAASNEILLRISFQSPYQLRPPVIGFTIMDAGGAPIYGTNTRFENEENLPESMSAGEIEVCIDARVLRSGTYHMTLWLGDHWDNHDEATNALRIDIGNEADYHIQRPSRAAIGSTTTTTRYTYRPAAPAAKTALADASRD